MNDLLFRLAIALAIGFVVGVERGWRERKEPAGSRTAGIRTYALCGLLGGVSAAVSQSVQSVALLIAAGLAFSAIFTVFVLREEMRDDTYSITGLIAALLVFALGALAVVGDPEVAGAAAIATTALLASRQVLHRLVRNLTWPELRSAVVLLAMTVIVLPLLPDHAIDPFNAINPRQIWFFMVLTATISYAGYVAVKVAGPEKGILLSALGGALVSSTAVAIAFARRAAQGEPPGLLAGGGALAAMVSCLRVLVICAVVAPGLLWTLAPAVLAAAAAFGVMGVFLMRGDDSHAKASENVGNPFDIGPLVAFAAMFAAVSAVSGALLKTVGPQSLYLVSAVAGIVDVDVPSLNAARLAGNGLTFAASALSILIALAMNAVGRVVFVVAAGTRAFALRYVAASAIAVMAGAIVFFLSTTL